eukprot:93903_1
MVILCDSHLDCHNWLSISIIGILGLLSLLMAIMCHHVVLKQKNKANKANKEPKAPKETSEKHQWVGGFNYRNTLGALTRKHAKQIILEWAHQNRIPKPQVTFEKRMGRHDHWKNNNTACDPLFFWVATVKLDGKAVQGHGQKKKIAELDCYQTLLQQHVMIKSAENKKNILEMNQLKKSHKTLESKYETFMSKYQKLLKRNQELTVENKLNKNNIEQIKQQDTDQLLKIKNAKNKLYESMVTQNNNIQQSQQKYDQLLKTNNELIAQNKLYESEIAQRNIICSEYNRLQNEHKELEIEYVKVKEELKKATNNCTKSRHIWQAEEVVYWIININKARYNKYFKNLMRNMAKENIDGHCLDDLDKTDLHRLGITDFKDKRDIYQSIQQLIKGNHNKNEQVEGHNGTLFV